ncbi:MAG: ABC transporter permease [Acidobacteria bacterium]|nr:ABC transporter permease [Acidobacteriota bacterium]
MAWVSTKYAVRSVGRNARRTALSVLGIGIGCALALVTESMNRGRDELFARMGAYSGAGHVRVVPEGWNARRDPRLRLADWQGDLAAARRLSGIAAVTVRARAQVLLAMGTHVVPVEMVGVDPENEPRTFRLVQNVQEGRYLKPGEQGAVVIGKAIAERLSAGLDDDILASAVGKNGNIESAMVRIVGIVSTGSDEADAGVCQVGLADVERLTGLAGAGEVTVILDDWRRTDAARAELTSRLRGSDQALTWGEISPEFKGHLEQDKAASRFISVIILLIVLLGVASAQLAAVLERRREFAVLSAIGMKVFPMVRLVLLEAVTLGVAGAAVGLAIGLPAVWRFSKVGLDFRNLMGKGYAFQGVVIEPIIYGDFGIWIVPYVLTVAFGATIIASLYPAWFAAKTDPAVALRVAQ